MVKDKWVYYILISSGMKFRKKKKYRYVIPIYTVPFRALPLCMYMSSDVGIYAKNGVKSTLLPYRIALASN
jgi:hypothetical protein